MTITLTTPESRPNATKSEVVTFSANVRERHAEAEHEVGYVDANGDFRVTRLLKIVYEDNSDLEDSVDEDGNQVVVKSFSGLVQRSATARNLKAELEQDAIDVGAVAGTRV